MNFGIHTHSHQYNSVKDEKLNRRAFVFVFSSDSVYTYKHSWWFWLFHMFGIRFRTHWLHLVPWSLDLELHTVRRLEKEYIQEIDPNAFEWFMAVFPFILITIACIQNGTNPFVDYNRECVNYIIHFVWEWLPQVLCLVWVVLTVWFFNSVLTREETPGQFLGRISRTHSIVLVGWNASSLARLPAGLVIYPHHLMASLLGTANQLTDRQSEYQRVQELFKTLSLEEHMSEYTSFDERNRAIVEFLLKKYLSINHGFRVED